LSTAPDRPHAGLLSLHPDTGHLTPLLLVGRRLLAQGARVTAFVPEEALATASRFGVPARSVGAVSIGDRERAMRWTVRVSRFAYYAYWEGWYSRFYMLRKRLNGVACVPRALAAMGEEAVDVIFADDHIFEVDCDYLAGRLGVPIVHHYSTGTNFRYQPEPFWLDFPFERARRLGRLADRVDYGVSRRFFPRRLEVVQRGLARLEALRSAYDRAPAPPVRLHTSMGIADLEHEALGSRIRGRPEERRFGVPEPLTPEPGSAGALLRWLDAGEPRGTLYLASGTMASMPPGEVRRMVRAALRLGLRMLVAGPESVTRRLPAEDPARLRTERWAPQTLVLQHPSLAGFVTHAGATSIQEALWNGVPVLCRPLLWDQHYNAWIAEQLGFGLCLSVPDLRRPPLTTQLRRLLGDEGLRERAAAIAGRLRAAPGDVPVAALLYALGSGATPEGA
jgi:UDP:flavonoid glycosyltransferase YjiC (YdhE family)